MYRNEQTKPREMWNFCPEIKKIESSQVIIYVNQKEKASRVYRPLESPACLGCEGQDLLRSQAGLAEMLK